MALLLVSSQSHFGPAKNLPLEVGQSNFRPVVEACQQARPGGPLGELDLTFMYLSISTNKE